VIAIVGLAFIASAFALLHVFRRPEGQATGRGEWIDVTLALIVTTAVGGGAVMFGAGVIGLFF
jgi:hypothetical protein